MTKGNKNTNTTTNIVKKTIVEQKKDINDQWSKFKRGDELKNLLIKFTREYKIAGVELRKDAGLQDALNKTVLGMKSIQTGDPKAEAACAKLSRLVKLTNVLINKERIPFKLVGDTKRMVFRDLDDTTTTNSEHDTTTTNSEPIAPNLEETPIASELYQQQQYITDNNGDK